MKVVLTPSNAAHYGTAFLGTALVALFLLSSCTGLGDYRKQGFDAFQWQFDSIEGNNEDFHKIIDIDTITVHIVTDRKYFNWHIAAAYGSPVAGYANTNNEIWLFGKRVQGKIVINQAILGHELNHLLNFTDSEVVDPDRLCDIGL